MVGLFHPDGTDSRGSHISLVVHVIDVNEFAPLFHPQGLLVTALDTPVGSTVGRISAFDPDFQGDAETGILYSITSGQFCVSPIFMAKAPSNQVSHIYSGSYCFFRMQKR